MTELILWIWARIALFYWVEQQGCTHAWKLSLTQNIIDCYRGCLFVVNPKSFDLFELEIIATLVSWLYLSFKLDSDIWKSLLNAPGPVHFMMAFKTWHASVAFDIEGARMSLVVLSLFSYRVDNVTDSISVVFWSNLEVHFL